MSEWVTVSKICLCHVHGGTIGLELLFLKMLLYHIIFISYHVMEGVCWNLIVNIENSERGINLGSCLSVDPTGRESWSINFHFFNLCHCTSSLLRLFCVGGRQSLKGNRKRHQVTDWQADRSVGSSVFELLCHCFPVQEEKNLSRWVLELLPVLSQTPAPSTLRTSRKTLIARYHQIHSLSHR